MRISLTRLNTTAPVLKRSPRGSTTDKTSPRRRKSGRASLLKQTVIRNFINSPKHKKSKKETPRTLVNDFLGGGRLPLILYYHFQWRIQDFPEELAPTPQGGAPTYDFVIFSQELHEIERIWAPGGARRPP